MKKFIIGVIVGVFLTQLFKFFFPVASTSLAVEPNHIETKEQDSKPILNNPPAIKLQLKNPEKPSSMPTAAPTVNTEKINNKEQTSKLREKFQDIAANIDEKNLVEAISMLESILKISPEELFVTESRDEEIALQRENELEVKFYERLPYQGQSKITSLECRTTVCKIELSLPEGSTFSPFPLLKWDASMKSSHYHKPTKENESPSMTVYYAIAGSNLPNLGFDTKYVRP